MWTGTRLRLMTQSAECAIAMRMNYAHKKPIKKKAVNLSLRADLIETLKKHNVNLSEFVEARIKDDVQEMKIKDWLEENKEAIAQSNAYYETHPLPSELYGLPPFGGEEE